AEPVTDVDTTAADVLEDLDQTLNAAGISLVFAELKDPVRRKIERYGLTRTINPHHFFPTIESAITAFREETGAQWTAAGPPADSQTGPGQTGPGQSGAGISPPRGTPHPSAG
ncbi:MAG TPA: sodium-independent anion transporter, partial [Streptosporangiaceae bacterium]|nr:sodium-independent anion transporter [Streptosporangiaceae bacterium]